MLSAKAQEHLDHLTLPPSCFGALLLMLILSLGPSRLRRLNLFIFDADSTRLGCTTVSYTCLGHECSHDCPAACRPAG